MKYSCKIVMDRSNEKHADFVARLTKLAQKLAKDKFGKLPKKLQLPFSNGDDSDNPEFEGCTVFNCSKKEEFGQPEVVDTNLDPVIDPKEIYSGMFCRVSLSPYCWEYGNKKGVSFGLVNVQKTRDGDPLGGGGVRADQEFDKWDDDDDDDEFSGSTHVDDDEDDDTPF